MKSTLFFFIYIAFIINPFLFSQISAVSLSGMVRDKHDKSALPFVQVALKTEKDSILVMGTVANEEGRFTFTGVKPNHYILEISYVGYTTLMQSLYIGTLSAFLDLSIFELEEKNSTLDEITITGTVDQVSSKMDKKTYLIQDNVSQSGGSILQAMQNLPGITIQDNKIQLRGNDKVTILIDGKQTALTGFGNQSGLDNLPSSIIEKIEIINNPSAKYEANGQAGIINIVMKKNEQEGLNGKLGLATGLGSLWVRKENLPDIRPQYVRTPKVNHSFSLNYRKKKINAFIQADNLYTQTLNKNEFVTRMYDDGNVIQQQLKRNRNTNFFTTKAGIDWNPNAQNVFTVSGLFGNEKIIDHGDQPFFNANLSNRLRLWQFLEDELKTTLMASMTYQHRFKQAGHQLQAGLNYTFHREDEKYFYDNQMPTYSGTDAFKLLSDEQVYDGNLDYTKPLKYGHIEAGVKFRYRNIPTNMNFIPGAYSVLDVNAGGWAVYKEVIPALYGSYVFENERYETELGLRMEYVQIHYDVNPNHRTYASDGYHYTQPFPNIRLGYKINDHNKISLFYNRRVDRPNEVDIRIFPKYDDAEIIKVGNPALKPQFTNVYELGYKTNWAKGYFYVATYYRSADATITRISTIVPNSTLVYAVFQNAGKSHYMGLEMVLNQEIKK